MVESDANEPSMEIVEWAKELVAAPLTAEVARPLVGILRSRGDARAEMAAWALGFGELAPESRQDGLDALLDVMIDESRSDRVRGQVAEAVGEQLQFSRDAHMRARAVDVLTGTLSDGSALVRFWSAFALGKLGATSALPTLRQLVGDQTLVPGWWTVGEEVSDAIDVIAGRTPPSPEPR